MVREGSQVPREEAEKDRCVSLPVASSCVRTKVYVNWSFPKHLSLHVGLVHTMFLAGDSCLSSKYGPTS